MGSISFFVVGLLLSSTVVAGSLKAAQWLPWQFVTQTFSGEAFAFDRHEVQLELNWQDIRPQIKNVHVQLSGQIGKTQFDQNGVETHAQNISATLRIAELSVNQIVKIELNGNVISVRLEARCSPIQVSIPRFEAKASALFVSKDNYWQPELEGLNLLIPADSWTISPVNCTGASGVGELITQKITQALKDPQTLTPLLQSWLAPQMQTLWDELWQKLLNATASQLRILSMERPTDKGVLFLVELPLSTQREVSLPVIRESNLSEHHPQLIFSQTAIEAIMEDRILAMIPKSYDLQQVEGFRTLMGSRLAQSFAWPDLRRFASKTPFYVVARPQTSALSLLNTGNGPWQASMKIEGSLQTFINNAIIDYMDWGLSLTTNLNLRLDDGVLTIQAAKPNTRMVHYFSGLYLLLYKPNQKISSNILQSAVQGFFKPMTVSETLPALRWNERSWKLQEWQQHDNLITMNWLE